MIFTLQGGHVFALLTASATVVHRPASTRVLIVVFIGLMLCAVVINVLAVAALAPQYLDYRTLAEGLRVQFYWAAAGVTSGNVTKFAHDNFLQMQDTGLGWIRNVMRVAGIECDVAPNIDSVGLNLP